jgi:hypothetical protein
VLFCLGDEQDLIEPHRRWIKDGEFIRVVGGMSGLPMTSAVRLHLFNDLLVISQKLLASYKFLARIPLLELWALPNPGNLPSK